MRLVREFWKQNYEEYFGIFWVNSENIKNFGKSVEETYVKNIWGYFSKFGKY